MTGDQLQVCPARPTEERRETAPPILKTDKQGTQTGHRRGGGEGRHRGLLTMADRLSPIMLSEYSLTCFYLLLSSGAVLLVKIWNYFPNSRIRTTISAPSAPPLSSIFSLRSFSPASSLRSPLPPSTCRVLPLFSLQPR